MTPNNKGKYQPWSHEEFMADRKVRRMTPTALKTYMMLLHEAFVCSTRPNLPDDEEELEQMAYCTDHEEWLSVRDDVLGMFSKGMANGKSVLFNNRLCRDWEKLIEIREKRAEAGKLGAESRWGPPEMAKVAKNSKEVSKEVKKEKISEENNGQEDVLKIKDEIRRVCIEYGESPNAYDDTWKEYTEIAKVHTVGAVVKDFASWMGENQGDTWLRGPVKAYLQTAVERLGSGVKTVRETLRSDEVVDLAFTLTKISDGQVAFLDKQRVRLADTLTRFTSEEIIAAFKIWIDDQDLSDLKNKSYLPGKFVQLADSLANTVRTKKQEADRYAIGREATKLRLQQEAETSRIEAEKNRLAEESSDPLGLFD